MEEFRYISYAQEVIFGAGALARLNESVHRFGWQRLLLCTNRSMRTGGHAGLVEAELGDCLVESYDQVHPHVPDSQVSEVLALAAEKNVDAIIGLGGGSPIGMAKATAFKLGQQRDGNPAGDVSATEQPHVPVIAIPTTYAGSEMTPVYGVTQTQETPPRKVTTNDPRITPKLVIYDPLLTIDLPPEMTASTGINALAHCIEALYSVTRNPLSTAAALRAVQHITRALYPCYSHGESLTARTEMLLGAHLAGLSLASVSMGLHHGLCHVLGGTANVPHGIANSIILPHAMRFNAEAAALQLLPVAQALGVPVFDLQPAAAVVAAADKVSELTMQMNLPQRLRQAGVKEADLPGIAQIAIQNRTILNNPTPVTSAEQIERLLREAW